MFTEFLTKSLILLFGYAMPAYECFKSIELPGRTDELRFWCKYWIIVSILLIFDEIADALTSRIPMYCELKLAFLVYLWYLRTRGADIVYKTILRPLLMQYEFNINGRLLHLHEKSSHLAVFYVKNFTEKCHKFFLTLRDYVLSQASKCPRIRVTRWNLQKNRFQNLSSSSLSAAAAGVRVKKWTEDNHRARRLSLEEEEEEWVTRWNPQKIRLQNRSSSSSSSSAGGRVKIWTEDNHRARHLSLEEEEKEEEEGSKLKQAAETYIRKIHEAMERSQIETPHSTKGIMPHRRRSQSRHLWGVGTYENKVHDFLESELPHDSSLGLWGMRGVGKSALLRLVRDSYAGGTSFDHVLFVGPGTGWIVNNVQHAIAISLGLDLPMMSSLNQQSRAKVISSFLEHKSLLLLLDDVREPFNCWAVGLPILSRRLQKIILATRSRAVCVIMGCDADNTVKMQCLRENDAWNLFKDKVGDEIIDAHPQVHQLAKQMVAECRGLPLALCVIGRAMSAKRDPREWRNAYHLLKAKHSQTQEDEGYSCLDILETELKDSFLVTSLWPEDGNIPKESHDPVNY